MYTLLEDIRTFAPLGFRFWDAATDAPVASALAVTAGPADAPEPRYPAVRTASGVFAFHRLPGLRAFTHPDRNAEEVEAGMAPAALYVRVDDPLGRFLPVLHRVDLPLPERGVYRLPGGSPPAPLSPPAGAPHRFYLFSAPTRPALPGMAAVRATLHEVGTRTPAAHAIVEVQTDAVRHLSVADAEGRVALVFPYPPLASPLGTGSPLTASEAPLRAQTWDLDVRVYYDPDVLDDPFDEGVPELRSILAQRQAPALVWPLPEDSAPGSPPDPAFAAALRFGQPCVLRTEGLPVLLIERQPSLP